MKALGMLEVYSFTTAVCAADVAAKSTKPKIDMAIWFTNILIML